MASILFIGDPHLKITRFDLACSFLTWVTQVAIKLQPDWVVNLGDTFDTHAVVRSELQVEFKNHVNTIMDHGVSKYFYVLGNHDFYKPTSSKYNALQVMENLHDNFKVIQTRYDVGNVTFLPHYPDHK